MVQTILTTITSYFRKTTELTSNRFNFAEISYILYVDKPNLHDLVGRTNFLELQRSRVRTLEEKRVSYSHEGNTELSTYP